MIARKRNTPKASRRKGIATRQSHFYSKERKKTLADILIKKSAQQNEHR